jgi:FkbM family methyltransferase
MLKRIARAVVPARLRRWWQWRKLERMVAGYPRRIVEHRYGGASLRVELADPLAEGWYDHDWDEPPEWPLLRRGRLRPGARVFDVGAHQGVVGLMLGREVGPAGEVLLLEPNPHNAARIARNVELNRMPWVRWRQAAVSDREGVLEFNRGLNGAAGEVGDYAGLMSVPALTLDALSAASGAPDVVLLDVEGFEARALAGATRTLEAAADWMVEVHVKCGLEAAGGSVEQVLGRFPAARFARHVHSEGDAAPMRLEDAPPHKLRDRFFLTALALPAREGER